MDAAPGHSPSPNAADESTAHALPVTRRGLLKAAGLLATVPTWVAGHTALAPRRAAAAGARWQHAIGNPRGSEIAVALSRAQQGKFGLMFPALRPFSPPDALLRELAKQMLDPRSAAPTKDPSDHDELGNLAVPAGFTFLGQFIDHDMTRDLTPLDAQRGDPHAVRNFDTPFFDLGSVYGRGPTLDPDLYEPGSSGRLRVSSPHGFPDLSRRDDGSALLGDPRNDENLVIAQLHAAFLQFHNRLLDGGRTFAAAQRQTRWHFQWLIVNDFLPRLAGREVVDRLLTRRADGTLAFAGSYYRPGNPRKPMIPVEYSVAAYRFGHSMVRPQYEMNDADIGTMFGSPDTDLSGGRVVPSRFQADWTYFYDIPGEPVPDGRNFARLIDTKLASPLHDLPAAILPAASAALTNLAERNLLRGKQLGLPAGQDVARAMGQTPLSNTELGLSGAGWGGKAPLWFYVLKEAELRGGKQLGPVGGRIVAEVILGILALDPGSYFMATPAFSPGDGYGTGNFLQDAGVA